MKKRIAAIGMVLVLAVTGCSDDPDDTGDDTVATTTATTVAP